MFALLAFAQVELYISNWSFHQRLRYQVIQECPNLPPRVINPRWVPYNGPLYSLPMQKATLGASLECTSGQPTTTISSQLGNCTQHLSDLQRPYYLCPVVKDRENSAPPMDRFYGDESSYAAGIQSVVEEFKENGLSQVFDIHIFESELLESSELDIVIHLEITLMNQAFTRNGIPIQFRNVSQQKVPTTNEPYGPDARYALLEQYATDWNALNLFIVPDLNGSLGSATSPGDVRSGVFLGQDIAKGATQLSTSVGLWLGLYRTSHFGCDGPEHSDYVLDTPTADPIPRNPVNGQRPESLSWSIEDKIDTCGNGVLDDTSNFVDFTTFPGHFTPGQVFRMMIYAFWRKTGKSPRAATQF